jgi:hypothetical protein
VHAYEPFARPLADSTGLSIDRREASRASFLQTSPETFIVQSIRIFIAASFRAFVATPNAFSLQYTRAALR